MKRFTVKAGAALLAGFALALLPGNTVGAAVPDEGAAPPAETAATQERYHLYGFDITRAGERYTYLGAYDSAKEADAAGKEACHPESGEGLYQEYRVVQSAGLALPPYVSAWQARSITIYRLQCHDKQLVGRYDTEREATAAAEKVLAERYGFQAVYSWR
jgi:hypothetical protein